jgi:hypothetical protein
MSNDEFTAIMETGLVERSGSNNNIELEGEYSRRNDAILAVMAYCPVQEPPLLRTRKTSKVNKGPAPQKTKISSEEIQAHKDIGTAITSVFVKSREERSRRCFLCVWEGHDPPVF